MAIGIGNVERKNIKRLGAFVLILALLITCIVPISSFGSDSNTAYFQFFSGGEDGNVIAAYTSTKTEGDESAVLSGASSEDGSLFDVEYLMEIYSQSGESPTGWYIQGYEDTTFSPADLAELQVEFGGTLLFVPIFSDDKDEQKKEDKPGNIENKNEETESATFTVQLYINGSQYGDDIIVPSGSSIEPSDLKAPEIAMPEGAVAFQGWYEDIDSEDAFDADTKISGNTKLFAKYRYQYVILFKSGVSGVSKELVTDYEYYSPGSQQIIKPPTPEQVPGYNFQYWYDEEDEDKTPVSFNASLVPASDKTYIAKYSNTVNVVFISDGTQIEKNIQTVPIGGKAENPMGNPTRTGYTFGGWAKVRNADKSEYIDFNNDVFNEDTVLYAQWNKLKVSYTIVYWFEKPDIIGEPGNDDNNYRYNHHEIIAPTGNSSNDDKNGVASSGDTINVEKKSDGIYVNGVKRTNAQVTYGEFDHFENASYKVSGNGSTVINVYFKRTLYEYKFDLFNDIRSTYESYASKPGSYSNVTGVAVMTAPDLNGDGQAKKDSDGNIITKKYRQTYSQSDCGYVLHLKYQQNIEEVFPSWANAEFERSASYVSNNRIQNLTTTNFASWKYIGSGEANYVSKRIVLIDKMIPSNGSSHTLASNWESGNLNTRTIGYYFEVFDSEKAQYEGITKASDLPKDIVFTTSTTGGKTTYTYYKRSELYSQSYKSTGTLGAKDIEGMAKVTGSLTKNGSVSENESFAYTRSRNNISFNAMGGNISISDNTEKIYKDKFVPASGSNLAYFGNVQYEDSLVEYVDSVKAIRNEDGVVYKFDGWYYDSAYRNELDKKDIMPNSKSGVTLYAKWVKTDVTVSFYDGFPNENPKLIETASTGMNEPLTTDLPFDKGDYDEDYGIFLGWYYGLTINGVKQYIEFEQSAHITADIDLYAKWDATGYIIKYLPGSGNIMVPEDNNTYVSGIPVRVKSPVSETENNGSIFIGWKASIVGQELQGIYYPGSLYTIKGPTSMTAIYGNPIDFIKLTYHSNYPDSTINDDIYEHNVEKNSTQTALDENTFIYEDQKIIGWSKDKDGTVDIKLGEEFKMGTEDMHLYAVWAIKGYDVTFNTDIQGVLFKGSSQQTGSITYEEIEPGTEFGTVSEGSVTAKVLPAYQDTYYFAGWVDDYDTENPDAYVDIISDTTKVNKNYSYTAKYLPKEKITIKAASATKEYDGKALTENGWTMESGTTGALNVEVKMTAESTVTNVGKAVKNVIDTVTIYDGSEDVTYKYNITKLNGELNINQRPITITASSAGFYYDETEHTADDYAVEGLITGHAVTEGVKIEGSIIFPGSTTNKAIDDGIVIKDGGSENDLSSNYKVNTVDGILTVTIDEDNPMAITITGEKDSKVYNGYEQSVSGYTVTGKSGTVYDISGLTVDKADGRNAGTYNMGLATTPAFKIEIEGKDVTKAYSVEINDGQLTITKRPLVISAESHNFLLSDVGKKNVWHEYTYQKETGDEGLVSGHAISKVIFDSGSFISEPDNSIDNIISEAGIISSAKNDVTGNYDITFNKGILTMTDAGNWVLSVAGKTATDVYDATEKTISGFSTNLSNYTGEGTFASMELVFTEDANIVKRTVVGTVNQELSAAIQNGNIKIIAKKTADSKPEDITNYFDLSKTTVTDGALHITKATVTFSAIDQTVMAGTGFEIPSYKTEGFPQAASDAEKAEVYKRTGSDEKGYLKMTVDSKALSQYEILNSDDPATYIVSWDKGSEEPENYNILTVDAKLTILPYGEVKYDANVNEPGVYSGEVPVDTSKYWNNPQDSTDMEVQVMGNNNLTRTGYDFIGWEYDGKIVSDTFAFPESVLAQDSDRIITLYAVWERDLNFDLTPYDSFYDGYDHTVGISGAVAGDWIEYTVTDATGGTLDSDTFQFTGRNDLTRFTDVNSVESITAGSFIYEVTITADNESASDTKSATFNIRPVPLSFQPVYAEKDYDGTALAATEYTRTGNMVNNEEIDEDAIQFEGVITDAGITTSGILKDSIKLKVGRSINNYDIDLLNNMLKVNAVQGQIENTEIDDPDAPGVLGEEASDNTNGEDGNVLGEEAKTSDVMNMTVLKILAVTAILLLIAIAFRRKEQEEE